MKPLITALGICALLLAPTGAYAQTAFTWDGTPSSAWDNGRNWGQATATPYPGWAQDDDTATIADPSNNQCVLSSALSPYTLHWMKVDATSGAMSLTLNSSAWLDIDRNGGADSLGYLQLIGGATATYEATFSYQAGSFACDWINMDGGTADTMEAILDIDTNFSVGDATDSVLVTGYAAVDVEASYTFTAKDVEVGDGYLTTYCEMRTGTGTMTATSLDIVAGDAAGEHAEFLLSSGTVTVSGDTNVIAHDDAVANATLTVNGANASLDPGALYLYGGDPASGGEARFKLEENGTLTCPDSITMQGNSMFETEQSITCSSMTLTVRPDNDDNYATEAVVRVVDDGETMTVGTLSIGGANYTSQLTFTGDGSLATG